MIDAKSAALEAVGYLKQLYPEVSLQPRIEEIELSDDELWWYITLTLSGQPFRSSKAKNIYDSYY